jgi:hypothetical protein
MSGKPVKSPATKNRPVAVGFVTQALGLIKLTTKVYIVTT